MSPRAAVPQPSRRSLLRGAAGAGVAGLAITALADTALAAPAAAATGPAPRRERAGAAAHAEPLPDAEPLIVHVRDARTGVMDVYRGTSHTRLRDPGLAAYLSGVSA